MDAVKKTNYTGYFTTFTIFLTVYRKLFNLRQRLCTKRVAVDDRSLLTYNKKYRRPHPVIKVTSEKNSTQRICVKILIILIKLAVYSQFSIVKYTT